MKLFKKNQVIIYILAIVIMTVGYLNYNNKQENSTLETSIQMEGDDTQLADIGDAQLVNSNDVVSEDTQTTSTTSSNPEETEKDTTNNDYFTQSKLERSTMYSQMIENYEKILNSNNSLETQKQIATEEITKINQIQNSIMICENLIKTKGFENNIIFVNNESISIIIGTNEIKQEEIAQIQNIIAREMKVNIEDIHISTK